MMRDIFGFVHPLSISQTKYVIASELLYLCKRWLLHLLEKETRKENM